MSGQRGSAIAVLGPRPPKSDPTARLEWNQKYRALNKEHFAEYRKQRAGKQPAPAAKAPTPEVIDMASRPVPSKPLAPDPYKLDETVTLEPSEPSVQPRRSLPAGIIDAEAAMSKVWRT